MHPIKLSSLDKYLLVYGLPLTSGWAVSVTDVRIVDRGVLVLTSGSGRYGSVIHPSSTGMCMLPFYSTVQIKGVVQLGIFLLRVILWLSSSLCGIRKVRDILAPYLYAVMACCWLARDGLGKPPPLLLNLRVYYRELSPAGLGISRYIGAACYISG